jgi:regulator of protease activity HflC (stomatin/prohibitin superfamily)
LPWGSLVLFTLKTQLLDSQNQVPTQEGLNVELDVSILYHIQPSAARELYLTLGTNYQEVLIKPELASAVRGLTSEQSAKALYTSGRRTIQTNLKQELVKKFESRGIILEDVLLKAIVLPKMLTDAIEVKAQAEQESARMEFVLSKEEAEAKRKQIEAKGIQSFQKIVSEGISKELLMWKGIEATEKLAASKNAKIVMMGNNDKSMPVLFSANELPGKSN